MSSNTFLYGIVAAFDSAEAVLAAARRFREAGYEHLDAYTPFPVEGLAEEIGFSHNRIPLIVLVGAIVGALLGYGMQYYSAVIDYPFNIGGRPLHSAPAFMLVTFELAVLFGALGAFLGMLVLNGLPEPHHPIFNAKFFQLASQDRFFLCIKASDPNFDEERVGALFSRCEPLAVSMLDEEDLP